MSDYRVLRHFNNNFAPSDHYRRTRVWIEENSYKKKNPTISAFDVSMLPGQSPFGQILACIVRKPKGSCSRMELALRGSSRFASVLGTGVRQVACTLALFLSAI